MYKDDVPYVVVSEDGKIVTDESKGFDEITIQKLRDFLHPQEKPLPVPEKPQMEQWQKYYENDKLFFQDNSPAFISHYDAFGRIGYEWAVGRRGKAMIGVGGGRSHDRFYSNDRVDFTESSPEQTAMDLAQAIGRF